MADASPAVPRHVRARLQQVAEPRIISAEETVIPGGQLDPPLLILTAGALSSSLPCPDGRTAVVAVLSAGDVIGGDPGEGLDPTPRSGPWSGPGPWSFPTQSSSAWPLPTMSWGARPSVTCWARIRLRSHSPVK
jgi:hypothetical protein